MSYQKNKCQCKKKQHLEYIFIISDNNQKMNITLTCKEMFLCSSLKVNPKSIILFEKIDSKKYYNQKGKMKSLIEIEQHYKNYKTVQQNQQNDEKNKRQRLIYSQRLFNFLNKKAKIDQQTIQNTINTLLNEQLQNFSLQFQRIKDLMKYLKTQQQINEMNFLLRKLTGIRKII